MRRRAALAGLLAAGAGAGSARAQPVPRAEIARRLEDARVILRPNSRLAPGDDALQFIRRRSGTAAGVLGLVGEWLEQAGPGYAPVLAEVRRAREAAETMDEDGALAAIRAAQRELSRVR